jgi:hypothetical protein
METFTNILVAWPKGMTGIASTYVAELDGTSLWIGYLGKGGAHADLKVRGFSTIDPGQSYTSRAAQDALGSKIGNAIGGKVIDKFREEIDANVELYNQGGRGMLDDHKKTRTIPLSDISKVELTTKTGMNTPPALKGLPGPHLSCKLDGKTHILFAIPSSQHSMTEVLPLLSG